MAFHEDHLLETFKSLIFISIEGLKSLLLINGGAVVALLAFLGQSSLGPTLAPQAWVPIAWFVAGTAFSTIAFLGSYATQFALYNERVPTAYAGPKHMTFLYVTVTLVIASLVCFSVGAFESLRLFASNSSTPTTFGLPISAGSQAEPIPHKASTTSSKVSVDSQPVSAGASPHVNKE